MTAHTPIHHARSDLNRRWTQEGEAPRGAGSGVNGQVAAPGVTSDLRRILRDVFGYSHYRNDQQGLVEALMRGQDAAAVMPTGGGKSLCYQLPAICREGCGIIVSPLISLMKDQVDKLCACGVRAGYLNSTLTPTQQTAVLRRLEGGQFDLLYVAPERFQIEGFMGALKRTQLALFAIDEAHCISEWGHDFRPDYLKLSELRGQFPAVPIAAFTATATHRTREQIVSRLGLRSPHCVLASFDRPNLYYEVYPKRDADEQIAAFIRSRGAADGGIVYRFSRKSVEETAATLSAHGIDALPYHAGLEKEVRHQNQEAFIEGRCRVIVATIAFGMGIDKPDVRFVIHADLPKNVEGYYQETGRAGRDGKGSHCLLLYSGRDAGRIRYFIDQIQDPEEHRRAGIKLDAMLGFAVRQGCHRRELLHYFGEGYPRRVCSGCARCRPKHAFGASAAADQAGRSKPTVRATLELIRKGLPLAAVATQRGLATGTIVSHVAELIEAGQVKDLDPYVTARKRHLIESLLDRFESQGFKPVVEAGGGRVSYGEVRLVHAARKASTSVA